MGEISAILFFLIGAMTIVELIDSHGGFDLITFLIKTRSRKTLLWAISFLSFFLSAVLDNLTTAIVMVMLIRKLIPSREDRFIFVCMIILAANAGGAWSPIGDVTTTMLWISGRITALNTILWVFLPGLFSLLVPLMFLHFQIKG